MPSPHPEDTLKWDALRPLKTELARESFVQGSAFADNTPGGGTQRWVLREDAQGAVDKPLPAMSCDADYPALIGMAFTIGRTFDPKIPTDQDGSIIVNEALVKAFGWTDPLNEKLYIPGDSVDQETEDHRGGEGLPLRKPSHAYRAHRHLPRESALRREQPSAASGTG